MKDYYVVNIEGGRDEKVNERVNELAKDGWVLVQAVAISTGAFNEVVVRHYFERIATDILHVQT